jgi:hypothetical protein
MFPVSYELNLLILFRYKHLYQVGPRSTYVLRVSVSNYKASSWDRLGIRQSIGCRIGLRWSK